MVPQELKFVEFLGKGLHGSVSLFASSKPSGTTLYAAKTCRHKHAVSLDKEFKILSQFKNCPGIIQCYGNTLIENQDGKGNPVYTMLMEYATEGSLRNFMHRFKDKKLPHSLIREFTRMLLQGLATIHEHGYVHCALNPDNILVSKQLVYMDGKWRWSYSLKISDFWLSERVEDSDDSRGETRKGIDQWSLGCVVLEMYTGNRPWWHKYFKNSNEPLVPSDLHKNFDLEDFMTCFAVKASERKDAMTLLESTFENPQVNNEVSKKKPSRREWFLKPRPPSTRFSYPLPLGNVS